MVMTSLRRPHPLKLALPGASVRFQIASNIDMSIYDDWMFRLAVFILWSVQLLHSQTSLSSMHVALMFTLRPIDCQIDFMFHRLLRSET